jgi:Alpha/beta hydrolase domain
MLTMPLRRFVAVLLVLGVAATASAEVVRVTVASRTDVDYGYEKIVGRVFFTVDPKDVHNAIIADLDKAPRNAAGLVEFSSDLYILRPKTGGAGVALVDIVNRGRITVLNSFNRSNLGGGELGDGLMMKRGFTVVAVGWEFDVPGREGAIRIEVPAAMENGQPVSPVVSGQFIPDKADRAFTLSDLAGYTPAADSARPVLTVRDSAEVMPDVVPAGTWTLSGNTVTSTGAPFTPGRIYELTYHASHAPVAGLGFAAVRDVVSWIRNQEDALARARYVYAFGSSQSGRFLRTFLYQGFNTDLKDAQVFDGVLAHIAGAARLDLNRRGSTPTTFGGFSATAYPFAARALRDPVSSANEGLLDNPRARRHQPKMFLTNTGVEYWGGGRSAALVHTSVDGRRDEQLGDNVRAYFFAGTQHGPGAFPPQQGAGQQRGNPTDYWWSMRALLVAMDRWVREGAAPPASRVPRLDDGTLVATSALAFPAIPGVQNPNILKPVTRIANPLVGNGGGAGATLPLLVPQVDADGNERAGIRLPEIAVPLATYSGWNFRHPSIGAPERIVPLLGSYIPLARTREERTAQRDPRPSIAERYPSRERHLTLVREAAAGQVRDGYLLEGDTEALVKRASDHWDLLAGRTITSASRQ